jgi:hypothetical protein
MTPERGRASITAQKFSAYTVFQTATTKAGNSKDNDDGKADLFQNGDWRADRARGGGVLAGTPGHDLSLTQGTKTAGIPGRCRLAIQTWSDRALDDTGTDTKLIIEVLTFTRAPTGTKKWPLDGRDPSA